MKIVLDTNVIISGLFFGGKPELIIKSIIRKQFNALATEQIINEYIEIINRTTTTKNGIFNQNILSRLINSFEIINSNTKIEASRDRDDNKFIECAYDGNALYIISGDNDLLSIKQYKGIKIITVKEFCDKYLSK